MMMIIDPAIVWLILIVILLIVEIATMGLTTIWFAGGALAAFVAALLGAGMSVQTGIFLVLSLVLLICTRPVAVKWLNRNKTKTNADSLIGRVAVVTGEIDNLAQKGEVMMADISWTARTKDDCSIITKGSKVRICAIEGVKLIVEEIKEDN